MQEEFKSEIVYDLKQPFEYDHKGDKPTASRVFIKAPSNRVAKQVTMIEEEIGIAKRLVVSQVSDEKKDSAREIAQKAKDDGTESDTSVLEFTKMFGGENCLANMLFAFKDILTTKTKDGGVCMVDGVERLTAPLFDEMGYMDTMKLLDLYIENFINTSQGS